MGNTKTDSESDNIDVLNVFDEDDNDTDDETSDNEDVPNSHEDAEVDVVVSDESEDKQVDDTESIK